MDAKPNQIIDLNYGLWEARNRDAVCRAGEYAEEVLVLCEGWAIRYVDLPDGGRQIIDIILPGEMFTATAPFRRYYASSVQAITDVRYARIARTEMEMFLFSSSSAMHEVVAQGILETDRLESLIADLGRRTATERVARLVVSVMDRLAARDRVRDGGFDFPLRQQHVGDAVGLTQVHVNRILRGMRDGGVMRVVGGRVQVDDVAKLRRLAGHPD